MPGRKGDRGATGEMGEVGGPGLPGGPLEPFSAIHLPGPALQLQPAPEVPHTLPPGWSLLRLLSKLSMLLPVDFPNASPKAKYGSKLTSKSSARKDMSPRPAS